MNELNIMKKYINNQSDKFTSFLDQNQSRKLPEIKKVEYKPYKLAKNNEKSIEDNYVSQSYIKYFKNKDYNKISYNVQNRIPYKPKTQPRDIFSANVTEYIENKDRFKTVAVESNSNDIYMFENVDNTYQKYKIASANERFNTINENEIKTTAQDVRNKYTKRLISQFSDSKQNYRHIRKTVDIYKKDKTINNIQNEKIKFDQLKINNRHTYEYRSFINMYADKMVFSEGYEDPYINNLQTIYFQEIVNIYIDDNYLWLAVSKAYIDRNIEADDITGIKKLNAVDLINESKIRVKYYSIDKMEFYKYLNETIKKFIIGDLILR